MREVAGEVVLHVGAAQAAQAVVAHRLDYTPEVVIVQRGGLPGVAAQYTRFRRGQLTRDQRVVRRGIAWGRHKGMRRYRRGGRVAVVKAILQGCPCAGRNDETV